MCRPARTSRDRTDVIRTQVSGETGIAGVLRRDVCSEQPYAFVVLSNHISARCVPPQTTTPGPRVRSGRHRVVLSCVVRSGLVLCLVLALRLRLAGLAEPVEPAQQLAERGDVAGRPVGEVLLPAGAARLADAGQPL